MAKVEVGLAEEPDELIMGISDYLMEVGFSSSFLDRKELKMRGMCAPLWQVLTRAIINPLSTENKIFLDNLGPKMQETKRY